MADGFLIRANTSRQTAYLRPDVQPPNSVSPSSGFYSQFPGAGTSPPRGSDSPIRQRGRQLNARGSRGGFVLTTWYESFWRNRVHVIDPTFDAGRVLSPVENSFTLYNAGETIRDQVRLAAFAEAGTEGITLDSGTITPFVLPAKSGEDYAYTVETEGPARIEASYTFALGLPANSVHRITGVRLTIMAWQPQRQLRESWAWNTAILPGASGQEQRVSSRDLPLQTFEYQFRFTEPEAIRLEATLWEWAARVFAVPIWMDSVPLTAAVSIGDDVLPVTTTADRSFAVGELVALVQGDTAFEVATVNAVASTSITLERPLLQTWATGTLVIPMREAYARDTVGVQDQNVKVRSYSVTFDMLRGEEAPSAAGFATYRGAPIWDDLFVTEGSYRRTLDQQLVRGRVDRSHGRVGQFTYRERTVQQLQGLRVVARSRAELWRLKRWFWSLRGRQGVFWMPSGQRDFTMAQLQASAGVEIAVNLAFWARFTLATPAGRRDIRITYTDGVQELRRIVTATETGGNDLLELDSATGRAAGPANVAQIEFLYLRRLDTDRIDFDHSRQDQVVINLPIRDADDDV